MRFDAKHFMRILPILLTLVLFSCKKPVTLNSVEAPKNLIVDGLSEDWKTVPMLFLEKEAISLGVANDSSKLYILFRLRNPRTAGLIRKNGLILWINSDDKTKRELGLQYAGGPYPPEMKREFALKRNENQKHYLNNSSPLSRWLSSGKEAILINRPEESKFEISTDGSQGIWAGFSFRKGIFNYEFGIPFRTAQPFPLHLKPGDHLTIGLEITPPEAERRPMPRQKMNVPGGQRRPGAGFGGRRRDGGRSPRAHSIQNTMQPIKFWANIELAPMKK